MKVLMAALLALAPAVEADAAFQAGQFDDAKAAYSTAIAAAPGDAGALAGRAMVELYENDLTAAARDARAALALDAKNERASRVLRTVAERRGAPGEFAVSQTADAVLPFVVEDPLPVVRFKINGIMANVLIDTGAPTLVLTQRFADAHQIKTVAMGQGVFAGGKTATVYGAHVDSVEMPGLTVRNIDANVLPLGGGPMRKVVPDAIVGTSFFAHFKTTIDYIGQRLVLQKMDSPDVAGRIVADVPMWFVGDHFLFAWARINNGAPELLNVDTGGAGVGLQLTKPALDRAHIQPDLAHAQSFMGGGGPARAAPFTAAVTIGDATQADLPGLYFVGGDQYRIFPFTVSGTVTHEFFKHYALTFDFARMRLVLRQPG